ncbi:MAG: family acetyltransferase [Thermoleophilia bacterium]|nr:family acetyltransferase [Thermoleophilia bacterium]MCZ4496506.1 family acetyltransferase [Thermoleophilia bacterium]
MTSSLPAGYTQRAPTRDDAGRVLQVVAACERHEIAIVEVDRADIEGDWNRPGVDLDRDATFVLDPSGAVAAYAEVFASRAEGNVLPEFRGYGIGSWLADWILHRAREQGAAYVRQVVPAAATDRVELLTRAGYEASYTAWVLQVALEELEAGPALPAGVTVRDFAPGVDDAIVWRIIEDAFSAWPNRPPTTLEGWAAVTIQRTGFEPWMLRVLERDGTAIGAAYCIDNAAGSEGWVQQLAVVEHERGRGLGGSLLREAFGQFARRGRATGGLSTDSRTGALGLYERIGMHVTQEYTGMLIATDA